MTRYNEFDVSVKVGGRGWILAAYTMPPNAQEVTSISIVVRPQMNRNVAELLAQVIEAAYVSPIHALWQSPFPRLTNICLTIAYRPTVWLPGFDNSEC